MQWWNSLVARALPAVPRFIVGKVAKRYVAGSRLADAVACIEQLNREGAMATLDLLGEAVHEPQRATEAAEIYLRILDTIAERGLDANVSVKPTQLGLLIDEDLCRDNIARVVERAAALGNFVRIDMEDRTTTDATLRIYRQLHRRYGDGCHGHVGVVLQAYMRRTLSDVSTLPETLANVRLCKGIYVEPREDAYKGFEVVRHNFVAALDKLLRRGVYAAVATHDEYLVCAALALLDRYQVPRDGYEMQMLLGVDPALRRILIAGGHRLRVYVPYGRDWYPYSLRRLRENPAIAGHVMRAMLRGG